MSFRFPPPPECELSSTAGRAITVVTTKWHNVACVEWSWYTATHSHTEVIFSNFRSVPVDVWVFWKTITIIDSSSLEWMCACSDFDIRSAEILSYGQQIFRYLWWLWMYSHRRDFRIMDFKGLKMRFWSFDCECSFDIWFYQECAFHLRYLNGTEDASANRLRISIEW